MPRETFTLLSKARKKSRSALAEEYVSAKISARATGTTNRVMANTAQETAAIAEQKQLQAPFTAVLASFSAVFGVSAAAHQHTRARATATTLAQTAPRWHVLKARHGSTHQLKQIERIGMRRVPIVVTATTPRGYALARPASLAQHVMFWIAPHPRRLKGRASSAVGMATVCL